MELHPEITAITGNGWFSLGKKGLALFYFQKDGSLGKAEILQKGKKKKERYHVYINNECKAMFSKIVAAVEAVDYELEQMGWQEAQSARDDAQWRQEEVPNPLQNTLSQLKPPRQAQTISDALGYLCYAKHYPRKSSR